MKYVKICGLKQYEQVQLCIKNGADAVGFIYDVPSSPRNMKNKEIKRLLEQINNKIATVIVVKPSKIEDLEKIMDEFDATYFQVHCSFDLEDLCMVKPIKRNKIILALKLKKENIEDIIRQIKQFQNQFYAFLIDNSEGYGLKLDIDLIKEVFNSTAGVNLIIAGGVNIMNVEKIVKQLNPFGIDVSSSLESERGMKDSKIIKEFLDKIRDIRKNMRD